MLTKVEMSLKFNQILLKSEAKNFTEVAALACRGETLFSYYYFPINPTASLECFGMTVVSGCRSTAGP